MSDNPAEILEKQFEETAARLFGSPDGKFLLDESEKRVRASLFNTADPIVMSRCAGRLQQIDYFRSFVRTQ